MGNAEYRFVLKIRLLGKVEASVEGVSISLRGKSGLWLLGILTLQANRPVERDWLAGILWPESAPEQGRGNLRRTLTDLRHALGDAAPRLTSPTQQTISLQLADDEADVLDFLAGSLDSYTGELMPGCFLDWVENERRVLEEKYLAMGEREAASLPPASALVRLEQLRASAPLRESLVRLHLSVLCGLGNRAEAQQVYHSFRRLLLERRLGEPSAETQKHWAALQAAQPATPSAAASAPKIPTLPTPLTPCLGRGYEVEAVTRLLEQNRLVTLTGLGGIGKTRLAIEVGRQVPSVAYLGLADWSDGKQLAPTLEALLAPFNSDAPLLLVLDNFEHLVGPEANRALRAELEKRTYLRCLVTSRRALGMVGEQLFAVEPLELPQFPGSPERLGEFASIQLLVERVRALHPRFELTPQNTPDLVALAQQTEGIPLALELLAAHLRSLTPDRLLVQVRQARLPLLARREPGETPRHQSLWRIIESSVSFLDESQRLGFWKLAAFRGGCSLDAAQAICAPADLMTVVSLLETLTDVSLIRFASERYTQLETIRDFSLATQPEPVRVAAREAHAEFFLQLAEANAGKPDALPVLDTEIDNLRTAFETFLANAEFASAMRWIRAMRLYWYHRRGGQVFLESLLQHSQNPADCAEIKETLGVVYAMAGAYDAAQAHLLEALTFYRSKGDLQVVGKIQANLAGMAIERGNFAEARAQLEHALLLLKEGRLRGVALMNLGIVATREGDLSEAESLIAEALELRQKLGDSFGIAACLVNRGSLEMHRGRNAQAEATYSEALERFQKVGDRRGEATALEGLVEAFLNQDRLEEAERFLGEVVWMRKEYKLPETVLQSDLYGRLRTAKSKRQYSMSSQESLG